MYTRRVTLLFVLQFALTLVFVMYVLLIATNFAELFHGSLTQLARKRENDSWLRAKCEEQEFVHHMKQHIDLCETVERDAARSLHLLALQMTLDNLHLCGSFSCERIVFMVAESLRLSVYAWMVVIILGVVLTPMCVLPWYRRWQRNMLLHESRLCYQGPVDVMGTPSGPSVYIQNGDLGQNRAYLHEMRSDHDIMHGGGSFTITDARNRGTGSMQNSGAMHNNMVALPWPKPLHA